MKKLFVCFVCVLAAVCIASCDNTETKDVVKVIEKMHHKKDEEPAYNVEASRDFVDEDEEFDRKKEERQQPKGLFDEHFDKRD